VAVVRNMAGDNTAVLTATLPPPPLPSPPLPSLPFTCLPLAVNWRPCVAVRRGYVFVDVEVPARQRSSCAYLPLYVAPKTLACQPVHNAAHTFSLTLFIYYLSASCPPLPGVSISVNIVCLQWLAYETLYSSTSAVCFDSLEQAAQYVSCW